MESTPSRQQIREATEALQTELDTLRLNVKYLVFDLEATRRERERAAEIAHHAMRKVDRQNQIIASLKRRLGQ
jgi:chromosome segregation ATPase